MLYALVLQYCAIIVPLSLCHQLTTLLPLQFTGGPLLQVFLTLNMLSTCFLATLTSSLPVLATSALFGVWYAIYIFPPMQLPPPSGPYNVGVVDVFLKRPSPQTATFATVPEQSYIAARILYPTLSTSSPTGASQINYQPLGAAICDRFMSFGAPGPLKAAGFLLHHWLLIRLPFLRNAPLLSTSKPLPTVVYSHGLGGSSSLYSVQSGNLASHGNVVLVLDHQDGSTPLSSTAAGEMLHHSSELYELRTDKEKGMEWDTPGYVLERRKQIEVRIEEVDGAIDILKSMNKTTRSELGGLGVDFVGRLDVEDGVHLVGHSFGGATVLGAAGRFSDRVLSVTAHDPAIDWVPDDVRLNILKGNCETNMERKEGSAGYKDKKRLTEAKGLDDVPTLMIYCSEWVRTNFGHHYVTIDKLNSGKLGKKGASKGMSLKNMRHFEMSDNCLILPLWLCKVLGFSGGKPGLRSRETSAETIGFIKSNN